MAAALADPAYVTDLRELLERHGLGCWALGAHLVGQAVCDPIDERHRGILPPEIWGDGEPEGVHRRAAERLADTARAAAAFGVTQVNGFTGSPIWHLLYSFPPNDFDAIERGYDEVAERFAPDPRRVRARRRALRARSASDGDRLRLRHRRGRRSTRSTAATSFGFNLDPSHFAPQFLDAAEFAREFGDRIYHVHVKDSKRRLDGRRSILGVAPQLRRPRRGWDFVSPGHGDVDFDELFRALNEIGYDGPLSVEWEDSGMDRDWGAAEAVRFVRRTDFAPSNVAFDAAMQRRHD